MHAGELEDLDVVQTGRAQRLGDRLRRAADLGRREAVGGDAGNAREVDQRSFPRVEVAVEVPQGGAEVSVAGGQVTSVRVENGGQDSRV
jgi:hypothetical protein